MFYQNEAVDRDNPFQVWSFCDDRIVRIVASDFTICLYDEDEPARAGTLDNVSEQCMPGDIRRDIRGHYAKVGKASHAFWKRIT